MSPLEIIRELRHLRVPFVGRTMILGVVLGLALMSFLGRRAAQENVHRDFQRFTQWVSPETKYYPTINEMMAIVRAKAKPGQILVIVGGNSVMRGVGQPAGKIWTQRLQDELGAGYCVVNFAFNGSVITDAAAAAAEALRKEFPKQIYMANVFPGQGSTPEGSSVYRFVFWEAYAKGLLIDDPGRMAVITEQHRNVAFQFHLGFDELRIREALDRVFYFQDFWNDFTMTQCNTVYGPYLPPPPDSFGRRSKLVDPEPDFLAMPLEARYLPQTIPGELTNVEGVSIYHFNKGPDGKWQVYQPKWDEYYSYVRGLFPAELRKRTLFLLSRNSTYYMQRLTDDQRERNDLVFKMGAEKWREFGYEALDYGKDFHPTEDFGDRTHLTWKGGEKLAKLVAVKVRDMSQHLGYLESKP